MFWFDGKRVLAKFISMPSCAPRTDTTKKREQLLKRKTELGQTVAAGLPLANDSAVPRKASAGKSPEITARRVRFAVIGLFGGRGGFRTKRAHGKRNKTDKKPVQAKLRIQSGPLLPFSHSTQRALICHSRFGALHSQQSAAAPAS
jgi:hypothetical protein